MLEIGDLESQGYEKDITNVGGDEMGDEEEERAIEQIRQQMKTELKR